MPAESTGGCVWFQARPSLVHKLCVCVRERERERLQSQCMLYIIIYTPPPPHTHTVYIFIHTLPPSPTHTGYIYIYISQLIQLLLQSSTFASPHLNPSRLTSRLEPSVWWLSVHHQPQPWLQAPRFAARLPDTYDRKQWYWQTGSASVSVSNMSQFRPIFSHDCHCKMWCLLFLTVDFWINLEKGQLILATLKVFSFFLSSHVYHVHPPPPT